MPNSPLIRFAAALLGGLTAAAILTAVLFVVSADSGLENSTVSRPFGWAVPLLAGLMVGGVAWALLLDSPAPDQTAGAAATCETCHRGIMPDWRLCPYCGTLVSKSRATSTRSQSGSMAEASAYRETG